MNSGEMDNEPTQEDPTTPQAGEENAEAAQTPGSQPEEETVVQSAPVSTATPPEGWYPDTQNAGWRRYWDGTAWTDRREPATAAPGPAAVQNTGPTFCRACGKEIDGRAVICPNCGVAQSQAAASTYVARPAGARTGGIAILLSILWPGAGHLYADDNTNGIIFTIISAVNFLLSLTLIWLILGIPIWLGTAIWCSIDSNKKVEAWNIAHGYPAA